MPGEPLKTKVDLGCNFYCQARVPDPTKIFVSVGLGFFVELTLDEALEFISKKDCELGGGFSLKAKMAQTCEMK